MMVLLFYLLVQTINSMCIMYQQPGSFKQTKFVFIFINISIGREYWTYNGTTMSSDSPQAITDYGFDSSVQHIDAAMVWS